MPPFPEDALACLEWFVLGLRYAGEVPTWDAVWGVLTSRRRFEALLVNLDEDGVRGALRDRLRCYDQARSAAQGEIVWLRTMLLVHLLWWDPSLKDVADRMQSSVSTTAPR